MSDCVVAFCPAELLGGWMVKSEWEMMGAAPRRVPIANYMVTAGAGNQHYH